MKAVGEASGLRDRKKEQTRVDLVRAGLRLMGRDGYEAVTAAAIAAAVGVSRATFFNYFSSKEQLVLAADREQLRSQMARALATHSSATSAREALRSAIRGMLTDQRWTLAPDDELLTVKVQLLSDAPSLRAALLGELAELQHDWTELLITEYPSTTRTEAAALIGALVGAITHAVLEHLREDGDLEGIRQVAGEAARIALSSPLRTTRSPATSRGTL